MTSRICPVCKRVPKAGAEPPPLPFCSARCRLIDLGNWLDGRYVVSDAATVTEDGDHAPDATGHVRGRSEGRE